MTVRTTLFQSNRNQAARLPGSRTEGFWRINRWEIGYGGVAG